VRARSAAEDPGRHAFRGLYRCGEIGAERRPVVGHHRPQIQLPALLFRESQADQSASVTRHEIDCLRRDEFGCDEQVALVFAILLVDQHHHAPGAEIRHEIGNRTDRRVLSGTHTVMLQLEPRY
jgi:hypothetical protein